MSENLEFHYVVSYREGIGWEASLDTEEIVFPDGNIYDWDTNTWLSPNSIESEKDVEEIDLDQYRLLKYALRQMNNKRIELLMEDTNA